MDKKVTISEILWIAANECLTEPLPVEPYAFVYDDFQYSCTAVQRAMWLTCNIDFWGNDGIAKECRTFLRSLGCPLNSLNAYPRSWSFSQKQGARYAWLMLASQVAEERGL